MNCFEQKTVIFILAGGTGSRLMPLTEQRSKPAVSFGGKYRIIDFVLSNCINSGLKKIYSIQQYEPESLQRHLQKFNHLFVGEEDQFLMNLPPRERINQEEEFGTEFFPYSGTADAIWQNIKYLKEDKPEYVLILSGDQIYKMDYLKLLKFHRQKGADLTVATVVADREVAQRSGVIAANAALEIFGFEEKPKNPRPLSTDPEKFLVSMGIYVFNSRALIEELKEESASSRSRHELGNHVVPNMVRRGQKKIFAYPFDSYWRDVGTIESYFQTNLELCGVSPQFNLYDEKWKWRTAHEQRPGSKIVFHEGIRDSIISEGCIIDRGVVEHSVISPGVTVGLDCEIKDTVIMNNVKIGPGCKINRAIIDKENSIPPGSVIKAGEMNYPGRYIPFPSGIVVVPKFIADWNGI